MVSESQDRQIEHDAIKSEVVLPKKKKTQSMCQMWVQVAPRSWTAYEHITLSALGRKLPHIQLIRTERYDVSSGFIFPSG